LNCAELFSGCSSGSQETDWTGEAMYDDRPMENVDAFLSMWERAGGPDFKSDFGLPDPAWQGVTSASSHTATMMTPASNPEADTMTLEQPETDDHTIAVEEPLAAIRRPKLKKAKPRWLSAARLVWMLATLALTGFCLFMGLTGSHPDTKPIDQFQVGMIVPADALHGDNDLLYGERVSPKTWRHLFVRGKKDDGSRWDADLLVPLWWITEQQAKVGGKVHISVPECHIDGDARVVTLGPCPRIHDIDGRVVTSVFRHHSANVLDLRIEGLDEPIGTTANHPFFSVDRAEFVRADELEPGDLLRRIDGTALRVISSTPRRGTHTVYNLQVSVDHVYHVTKAGVLVHNAKPCGLVNVVEEEADPLGRWFARYGDHGAETFSARLLDGTDELGIAWTGNVRQLAGNIAEIQGAIGRNIPKITGLASDGLEATIKAGRFNADLYAQHISRRLGGKWSIEVIKRPGQDVWDIIATRIAD